MDLGECMFACVGFGRLYSTMYVYASVVSSNCVTKSSSAGDSWQPSKVHVVKGQRQIGTV